MTDLKKQLYEFILHYRWQNKGIAPSLNEMKAELRRDGQTILNELKSLQEIGRVQLKVKNGLALTRYIAIPGAQWRHSSLPSVKLTKGQHQTWKAIIAYKMVHNGLPPTGIELVQMLGIPSRTIFNTINWLAERGVIEKHGKHAARSYSLVGESWWHPDLSALVLAEKMPPKDKGQYGSPQWRKGGGIPSASYGGRKLRILKKVANTGEFTTQDVKEALKTDWVSDILKLGVDTGVIERVSRGHYRPTRSDSYA